MDVPFADLTMERRQNAKIFSLSFSRRSLRGTEVALLCAAKSQLAPRLIHHDGHGIGQIDAATAR